MGKAMPNWKAIGPDGLPAELLKLDHPEIIQCFHHILVNIGITRCSGIELVHPCQMVAQACVGNG